jgi:hypothetical protein
MPPNPSRGAPTTPPPGAEKTSLEWMHIPFPDVYASKANGSAASPAPMGGRGGGPGIFALAADGSVRSLSKTMGFDVWMAPTKFLPPNSQAFGLVAVEGAAPADAPAPGGGGGGRGFFGAPPVLYAATSSDCGGEAGVWALDLSTHDRAAVSWKTSGGTVAGTVGPAIGKDGTLYVATGDGDSGPSSYSNSVVALEAKTLKVRDVFSPGNSGFVSSPVVMNVNGKDLIAVANRDGRMYLLDSASLGGADHKTPLSASARYANVGKELPGALASWQDSGGTRWVLSSVASPLASADGFQSNGTVSNGAIVAFKVVDQGGKPQLQPGWVSRDIVAPRPPIVVNGVVFAAGTGPQQNAVLYALDGATGREFLNTGNAVTGGPPKGALSAQFGTIYLETGNNVLWALGFSQEYLKEDHGALFNK